MTIVLCNKKDCKWSRPKKEGYPVCQAPAIIIFGNYDCNAYTKKAGGQEK